MREVIGLVAGILFGAGLLISGMADPAKVLNFLDISGTFDPSLAFVMGGAVAVAFVGNQIARRRSRPLFDARFHVPDLTRIDFALVGGAALFGLGWGLSGFCPGPALVSIALLAPGTLVFVAAMLIGMTGATWFKRGLQSKSGPEPTKT